MLVLGSGADHHAVGQDQLFAEAGAQLGSEGAKVGHRAFVFGDTDILADAQVREYMRIRPLAACPGRLEPPRLIIRPILPVKGRT